MGRLDRLQQHLCVFRFGFDFACQAFPNANGRLELVAAESRCAGKPQGHGVLGVDLKRFFNQLYRFARKVAVGVGGREVGVVGKQLGIVVQKCPGSNEGLFGLGVASQHFV